MRQCLLKLRLFFVLFSDSCFDFGQEHSQVVWPSGDSWEHHEEEILIVHDVTLIVFQKLEYLKVVDIVNCIVGGSNQLAEDSHIRLL
jgi:hypothetical protein